MDIWYCVIWHAYLRWLFDGYSMLSDGYLMVHWWLLDTYRWWFDGSWLIMVNASYYQPGLSTLEWQQFAVVMRSMLVSDGRWWWIMMDGNRKSLRYGESNVMNQHEKTQYALVITGNKNSGAKRPGKEAAGRERMIVYESCQWRKSQH